MKSKTNAADVSRASDGSVASPFADETPAERELRLIYAKHLEDVPLGASPFNGMIIGEVKFCEEYGGIVTTLADGRRLPEVLRPNEYPYDSPSNRSSSEITPSSMS